MGVRTSSILVDGWADQVWTGFQTALNSAEKGISG